MVNNAITRCSKQGLEFLLYNCDLHTHFSAYHYDMPKAYFVHSRVQIFSWLVITCYFVSLNWKDSNLSHQQDIAMLHFFGTTTYAGAGFRLAYCSLLCHYTLWQLLAISELQLSAAALALLPSSIAPELDRIQLPAVRPCGQKAGLSIYWQDTAYRLIIPLWQVVLAKFYHQSSNIAS